MGGFRIETQTTTTDNEKLRPSRGGTVALRQAEGVRTAGTDRAGRARLVTHTRWTRDMNINWRMQWLM
jgi:hypothetical protein